MPLNFPNHICNYDAVNSRVRFWGADSAMEVAFFMDEEALFRMSPGTQSDETAILKAFNTNRNRIHEVAKKLYSGKRTHSYILTMKDFFK